ncbi:unnamed protein product [Haemonchus placei]|uniref:Transposase n=1 Tax=Haemonchus placei TaxID=6290 RepID=A0A0N4X8C4_HAEPC|nr:unnamed protein product [Haemonchus placei]
MHTAHRGNRGPTANLAKVDKKPGLAFRRWLTQLAQKIMRSVVT